MSSFEQRKTHGHDDDDDEHNSYYATYIFLDRVRKSTVYMTLESVVIQVLEPKRNGDTYESANVACLLLLTMA